MAQITLTIPDAVLTRVITALASTQNPNDPTPPAQFAKQRVIQYVKGVVYGYETNLAAQAATVTAGNDVNTNITIT